MMLYRFHCWEQADRTYLPSLVADCIRSGRVGYFESARELTLDITSMKVTSYEANGEPLLAIKIASLPTSLTLYAPLDDLAQEIAAAQDDKLWRLLRMTTRELHQKHHIA